MTEHELVTLIAQMQTEDERPEWSDTFVDDCIETLNTLIREARKIKAAPCGHSACRQNWIDTGERACIAGAA